MTEYHDGKFGTFYIYMTPLYFQYLVLLSDAPDHDMTVWYQCRDLKKKFSHTINIGI